MNGCFVTKPLCYFEGNLEAVRNIMFRNDVDLQIAGTTDVSNDSFCYSYHAIFLDKFRSTGLPRRAVMWFFFASELLQGPSIY